MALIGKCSEVLQRSCVVLLLPCAIASLEIRLKALHCDGLRDRQCEDQQGYDRQASHGLNGSGGGLDSNYRYTNIEMTLPVLQ